jgi:hypothetical protein
MVCRDIRRLLFEYVCATHDCELNANIAEMDKFMRRNCFKDVVEGGYRDY